MSKIEDLLNTSVSRGSYWLQDLSPAFHLTIRNLGQTPVVDIPEEALANWASEWWNTEDSVDVNAALFVQLVGLAPDGYYFGNHPGDWSDYGFWLDEEDSL